MFRTTGKQWNPRLAIPRFRRFAVTKFSECLGAMPCSGYRPRRAMDGQQSEDPVRTRKALCVRSKMMEPYQLIRGSAALIPSQSSLSPLSCDKVRWTYLLRLCGIGVNPMCIGGLSRPTMNRTCILSQNCILDPGNFHISPART